MAWDPALLRKYTTTNHFKLLNQIRSELRDQPIQRPLVTSRAAAAGAARRGGRSAEPQASQPISRRRGAAAATPMPSSQLASSQALPAPEHHQPIVAVPVITDLVLPDAHTGG